MWWVLSSFYFPRNTVLLSKKWHRVALYNTKKWNPNFSYISYLNELDRFFVRVFLGRRWLWCSRTMMLGPAAFGWFSYREVTPLPQMHQEIPKSTKLPLPRKVHDSLLEFFMVFFPEVPNFNENRWESFPTPSRRLKRKGVRGGLHRLPPPPNFVVGNKSFQRKTGKRSTSHTFQEKLEQKTSQHHKHWPKTNHFAVSHGVRWSESPRGFFMNIQVEDAGV